MQTRLMFSLTPAVYGSITRGSLSPSIRWEEATGVNKAKHPGELPLKEALHILMIPAEEHLNRETGLEISALRKQETTTKPGPNRAVP